MKKLSEEDKKEILHFAIMVLVSMAITISLVLVSIASDKKCTENHTETYCRDISR